MRSTRIHTARRATFTVMLTLAGLSLVAACGGKDTERVESGEPASTPAVVSSASSGETQPAPRADYSTVSYETAESTYFARDYGVATEMFDAYTERTPENPWGHYMLGLAAWKSGDLDRARSALERSLELDPTHVKTLLNLGRVLLEQDRAGEAKERVIAALELDSTSSEVHRMLGRVHTSLGLPDEAMDAYRTALVFDPADAWAMNNLALLLIHQERFGEALAPLARAVQLRPGAPVFQNNLGIALERTGRISAAREAYAAAVAADSTYRKSSASLERLQGVEDVPGIEAVELAVLADGFEREVQRWREERMASSVSPMSGVAEIPVEVTVVPDTVVVPETPPLSPR